MKHSDDYSNNKFKRSAISVEEAQKRVLEHTASGTTEFVPLSEAHGRFLAVPLHAPHPFPHFRRSGMDGYAVVSADTKNCGEDETVWLRVVDEIPCGHVSDCMIASGLAARIMTGAQVPEGADAVVMLEATRLREDSGDVFVGLRKKVGPGNNVTPIGFELREGELLLEQGRQLGAGEISALATFGIHKVPVVRKPRIAIISTGSELLSVDEPLQPGRIRNSNSFMLAVQIREAGGEPCILDAVQDDVGTARRTVLDALSEFDYVVTSGGVSVGDYDIMGDLVRQEGVDLLFNKVTMRPGSVTTAAVINGGLLFALSGNPGACFVGCELFIRPVIRTMLGARQPFLPQWEVVLGADYHRVNNFTRFVRAKAEIRDGRIYAVPAAVDESSVMISIKDSDCLIVIPPGTGQLRKGDKIDIIKLEGGGWS
ncbi:molybdopterin molybdotransferase MoeA [Paenibacillus sp. P96]|uniref:Molybdopterin molybdenumtransferase n=1 Tax=Paenibacillus zeirhizosphaerae TaxID=2987519 RepID=A0ABT9FVB4_9BACL|nr:gephyrin-like molybdotransferase Glp [Paenibacillus sp. P96]MDP4098669.1 molybdopterin molybdotransferase MoeA [Paenibacillus sp. P96]